jgi:hypothetical protein
MGLAFSKPEDCDCGLDARLIEAREYIGDRTGDKTNCLLAPASGGVGGGKEGKQASLLDHLWDGRLKLMNHLEQAVRIERLLDERYAQTGTSSLGANISRENDYRTYVTALACSLTEFLTFHPRHVEVNDDYAPGGKRQYLQRFEAVSRVVRNAIVGVKG